MPSPPLRVIHFAPPYEELFKGVLSFRTLAETEACIARLEDLRQRFLKAGDKKGREYCRRVAALGAQRAGLIARNRRVGTDKRLVKQEAALWFRIWLETPDLFADWLALRVRRQEVRSMLDREASS